MAIETTVTLTNFLQSFYERTFLENLKQKMVFAEFTKRYPIAKGFGPVIQLRRYVPMEKTTSRATSGTAYDALSEGTVPNEENLSAETVSATVAQYGNFVKLSDFVLATHMSGYNQFIEQAITELAYQAADIIDYLVREEFGNETSANYSYANGKTWATLDYGVDVATASDLRKIVRTLKKRYVPFYDNVNYIGIIGPGQSYDFQSEAGTGAWIDAHKYTSSSMIEKGELGKLYSVRLVESTNLSVLTNASGSCSECYVFGKDSVGMIDVTDVTKGDRVEMKHVNIYIKEPGSSGAADPLNQIGTVGYKFNLAVKRLQDSRVQVFRAGETA